MIGSEDWRDFSVYTHCNLCLNCIKTNWYMAGFVQAATLYVPLHRFSQLDSGNSSDGMSYHCLKVHIL